MKTAIDMHVHIVGNGRQGSGCWLRPTGTHKWLGKFMLRHIGLPVDGFEDPAFDSRYVAHLARLLETSSLRSLVILAQDDVYDANGHRLDGFGTFYVPNDYVLGLARQYPGQFLPAVSIHPARADAIEELDRCVAAGAVMLKLLPNCHNVDCNDRRYVKFWKRLAEHRLPFLAHTGGEHTLRVVRPDLQDPRVLELPLRCGVTCIAAHMAGQGGLIDKDYFGVLVEMMRRHSNLYGDISAFNIPFRSRHFPAIRELPLAQRVLNGSDYPVPVYGHWVWLRGWIDQHTLAELQGCPNVLERDYRIKRALGVPEEVFTRVAGLLRRPGIAAAQLVTA